MEELSFIELAIMTQTEKILCVLLVISLFTIIIFIRLCKKARKRLQREINHAKEDTSIKSSFLTLISQALRVPLNTNNAIFSEIMELGEESMTQEVKKKLDIIHENNSRIYAYLNEISELTNFNGTVPAISVITVNLAELIMSYRREVLYVVNPGVVVGIRTKMSPHCKAQLNTKMFRQIVMNVLDLAAQRTKEGSITINYHWEREGLFFKIEDTGGRIPDEISNLMFSDVLTEAPVIDMKYKSTIISLSICKSIVESMRGTIDIAPGEKGVIVNFWIPCYVIFD